MIHKKMLCSFVFMSFLFSCENIVAMYKKPVKSKTNLLASQVPLSEAITLLQPKFIATSFALHLDGKDRVQPMPAQWERFIILKYARYSKVPNVGLSEIYNDFATTMENSFDYQTNISNHDIFKQLVRDSKINNLMLQNLSLGEFLRLDQVKKAFMKLGADIVKNMQPTSVTPPSAASKLDEKKVVAELTDPNLDLKSPEAILAADKFLEVDEEQIMTRAEIERLYDEKMEKIERDFANQPKKQEQFANAAENAKDILELQINNPSIVTPPPAPKVINEPEVRKKRSDWLVMTKNQAVIAAEKLLKDNDNSLPVVLQTPKQIANIAVFGAQDLGPKRNDPVVIGHALEFLKLTDAEVIDRNKIEQAKNQLIQEIVHILNQEAQKLATKAFNQAVEILDHQVVVLTSADLSSSQVLTILNNADNISILNPNSAQVAAASNFLGLPEGIVISPQLVKKIYKQLALQYHPDKGGDTQTFQMLGVAKEILLNNIDNLGVKYSDSINPATPSITPPSNIPAKSPVSEKFRKKVASDGMTLAQELLKDGQSVDEFFNNSEFANENPQKIAYYKGYLQNCLRMLSNKQMNSAAVISKIAEVLRVLNMQQARSA